MTNDDAGRGGGRSGRFRSGIFRFFATASLVVGVLNVTYQELHQPSGIALVAENKFRSSHFRKNIQVADVTNEQEPPAKVAGVNNNQEPPAKLLPPLRPSGLNCAEYGGPSKAIAAEMVYWEDVPPSDAQYVSPFHPMHSANENGHFEEKYISFEPDRGGFNNIRMSLETVIVLAIATGRTLVLPPEKPMYLLHKGKKDEKKSFSFLDFFDLQGAAKQYRGFRVITMDEFLTKESGRIFDGPPHGETTWGDKPLGELWMWFRTHSEIPIWSPKECVAAIPATPRPIDEQLLRTTMDDIMAEKHGPKPKPEDFTGKPPPINATIEVRLGEILGERERICLYDRKLQAAPLIHMMDDKKTKTRLLTHSYTFVFFADWRMDLYAKRFIRNMVRYNDEFMCAAGRIIEAVRERARKLDPINNAEGLYDSFHVRRGEFQYKKTRVDADVLYEKSRDELNNMGGLLYIATDERQKQFFAPLSEHYNVTYLDDYMHLIPDINTNFYGMLDQLVASRGRVFFGTFFSSLSGYIHRLRGYHSQKRKLPGWEDGALKNSYYFVPDDRKHHMLSYRSPKLPLYMQEFGSAWRRIDEGIKELGQ